MAGSCASGIKRRARSLRPPSPTPAGTAPGLLVRYCDAESGVTLKTETAAAFPVAAAKLDNPCALRVEGMLKVAEPGKYILSLRSGNTDSTIFLNGMEEMKANRWGVHETGEIWLAAGNHAFAIRCPCSRGERETHSAVATARQGQTRGRRREVSITARFDRPARRGFAAAKSEVGGGHTSREVT